MDQPQAVQRLSHHANAAECDSFTFALWQADRQSPPPELGELFGDILLCLEAVNCVINTEHPSETIEGKANALQRSLVADVSSILSDGWSYYWRWTFSGQCAATFCNDLAAMLIQIGIAWDAVLAGDIDNIREHVRTEYLTREY